MKALKFDAKDQIKGYGFECVVFRVTPSTRPQHMVLSNILTLRKF